MNKQEFEATYPQILEGCSENVRPDSWKVTSINSGEIVTANELDNIKYFWCSPPSKDTKFYGWIRSTNFEDVYKDNRFPKNMMSMDLDELLDAVEIHEDCNDDGWFGIANTEGFIAYFGSEVDAALFRLNYINMILNS